MGKAGQTQQPIVILGGYGAVGSRLSAVLAAQFPGEVVVAGLDGAKAAKHAEKVSHGATSLAVNALEPEEFDRLFRLNPSMLVSCVELPEGNTLPHKAISRGISYTELSATYASHRRLLELDKRAQKSGAIGIVGVGLMPGLSNVLAADAEEQLDHVDAIDINLMLGLGEAHGMEAIKWTLRHLSERYKVQEDGAEREVASLSDPYKTALLDEQKPRTFYRFNFSDQHVLTDTLGVARVTSRLAFDSRAVTKLAVLLRKTSLTALINEKAAKAVYALTKRGRIGSDQYALQVEAHGIKDGRPATARVLARGRKEAEVTAQVAAFVVAQIRGHKLKPGEPGVFPIEKIIDKQALYNYLQENGVKIEDKVDYGRE